MARHVNILYMCFLHISTYVLANSANEVGKHAPLIPPPPPPPSLQTVLGRTNV